jgi:hypothetical protein
VNLHMRSARFVGVFALFFTLSLLSVNSSFAQGRPPNEVVIANVPVPVTGEVGVSGNVGIAGTPTVVVTNTERTVSGSVEATVVNNPTVGLASGAEVRISNVSSDPVPVTLVTESQRRPFQGKLAANWTNGQVTDSDGFSPNKLPADSRLVVEHVSMFVPTGGGARTCFVKNTLDGVEVEFPVVLTDQTSPFVLNQGQGRYTAHHAMHLIADDITFRCNGATPHDDGRTVSMTVFGYLIPKPLP